jgi:hypothetical protein
LEIEDLTELRVFEILATSLAIILFIGLASLFNAKQRSALVSQFSRFSSTNAALGGILVVGGISAISFSADEIHRWSFVVILGAGVLTAIFGSIMLLGQIRHALRRGR